MAENLRALIAILILSVPVLYYLRRPLTATAIEPSDYKLRMWLWLGLTVVLFVAHSFWLFMITTALALLTLGRNDSNPLGLYFFLLFLAPPFQSLIEGFAGINNFIALDYLRLLSLVILFPLAVRLWRNPESPRLLKMPADKYLLGYLALSLAITASVTSTTDIMRTVVSQFIDVFLPYYAFSRGLSDVRKFRDALASFAGICAVMAVIAVFETFKHWLLYSSLPNVLDVRWAMGGYMLRDGSLRATVSTGHAIILGYVMTVAMGLHLALRDSYPSSRSWKSVLILLAAGIIAALSRGPWVGAVAMVAVAVALSPRAGSLFGKIGLAAIVLIPVLLFTPWGAKIVALLPFVGDVDETSVEYRRQLFAVSWDILMQHPVFGSPSYLGNGAMEQMRQGEGIIDMVNSYLGIAMYSGFVGLALFAGVFASSGVRLLVQLARHSHKGSESHSIGTALFATLVGVLLIIATLSSINAVPVIYWCLAGACAAYLKAVVAERHTPPLEPSGTTHRFFAARS